ncbi:MAG TPA: hypothetical protein VGD67_04845 [Pseudonocardiaceae bacterium]
MPLQNRCTPFGELVACEARGTIMGNRGGKFHRPDRTLGARRWASRHWICCDMFYKNKKHDAMGQYYTSVFFLDEVTALSAGHRPCFFCRRKDAQRFLGLADPPLRAHDADDIAHPQRLGRQPDVPVATLPDGAMITTDDETAWAVRGPNLLRWSFHGYTEAVPRTGTGTARPLTPMLYVGILAAGFEPRWHPSADGF